MGENHQEALEIQDSMASEESGPAAEPRVRKIFSDLMNFRKYFNWEDCLSALIFGLGKTIF